MNNVKPYFNLNSTEMTITLPVSQYLKEVVIPLRLACTTESGWPFVLSLWYVHLDGSILCATQGYAKVVSYLHKNPQCGFEVASDQPPYCGVRGQAIANIEPDRGAEILRMLLARYLGSLDTPLSKSLLRKSDTEVAIRLDPVNIFTWNFTKRMKDSLNEVEEKVCP